ncbi:hypothetical protein DC3_24490 [Deinococcus cellulosilyticus NBRC 106333 = KACC 11606]|uniref:Transposase n=1 Tax=Deinococcus cellulosilyticus (strain DSM 18568 / NBRC 106333 / KACC 11606 / 5516J-15) TaxID=1223518 RepID=A0A511N1T8_DEIC1|nr:hypothetical protein [Deinococcus cellulosilyticus]GEM46814.1 hypothetical protein DC3_24490 [Deinococcus cellulosilyticus NBRC 106333 = KACC 11606]
MEEPCPNCILLEARLEEQAAQIADLQHQLMDLQQQLKALLQWDSGNSNQPPSQDKPWKIVLSDEKVTSPVGDKKATKAKR